MEFKYLFFYYFLLSPLSLLGANDHQISKMKMEIKFSKLTDFHVSLYAYGLFEIGEFEGNSGKFIQFKPIIFDRKCTECRAEVEQEVEPEMARARRLELQFVIITSLAENGTGLMRFIEVKINKPNFDKRILINLRNLGHLGHLDLQLEGHTVANFSGYAVLYIGGIRRARTDKEFPVFKSVRQSSVPIKFIGENVIRSGAQMSVNREGISLELPYPSHPSAQNFVGQIQIPVDFEKINGQLTSINELRVQLYKFEYANNVDFWRKSGNKKCWACLKVFSANDRIVQLHPEKEIGGRKEEHIFHEGCLKRRFEDGNFTCPVCHHELGYQTELQLLPLLSEKDGHEEMYMNNYYHLLDILSESGNEGSFEYRQALGAREEVENFGEKINEKLTKLLGKDILINKDMEYFTIKVGQAELGVPKGQVIGELRKIRNAKGGMIGEMAEELIGEINEAGGMVERVGTRAMQTIGTVEETEDDESDSRIMPDKEDGSGCAGRKI